jgi:hypothetical protein
MGFAFGEPQGRDSQRRPTEQHCRARGPSQKGTPGRSEDTTKLVVVGSHGPPSPPQVPPCDSEDPSAIAWLVSDGAAQGLPGTLAGRRKESPVAGRQSAAGLAG